MYLGRLNNHPRRDDLLETMRRWEDVREKNWLSCAQREAIKDPAREFHLYLDGSGAYELCEIEMLPAPAAAKHLRGFLFARAGRMHVAYWHTSGSGVLEWSLGPAETVSGLRYAATDKSPDEAKRAFAAAKMD